MVPASLQCMATAPQTFRDLSFGSRLRLARMESGFGLGELARAVGIHPDSLSDYERDRTDPSAKILGQLVEKMRERSAWVTVDWILFGATRALGHASRPASPGLVVISQHGRSRKSGSIQPPLMRSITQTD